MRHTVEARLANGASCQLDDTDADVDRLIVGFGLVSGNLGDVRLQGRLSNPDGVPARAEVRLEDVEIGAFGSGQPTAQQGAAHMTIAWSDLSDAMLQQADSPPGGPMGGDVALSAEDGAIVMEGAQFTVLAAVDLVDRQVQVTPQTLRVGGQELKISRLLPMVQQRAPEAAAQLEPRLIPLSDLPPGASPTAVTASDDGLVIDAGLDADLLLANASSCA